MHKKLGAELPALALVLGSGFDGLLHEAQLLASVAFRDLPGFPVPTVGGHSGKLLLAEISGVPMLVCCGRSHYYEGVSMESVMFPVRAFSAAGIRDLVLTNAAGGISSRLRPGDFMLIRDHINFTGVNPLRGLSTEGGKCFVDLTEAYCPALRRKFQSAARKMKMRLQEGIYLGVSGPSYETPAEIRAFGKLGADAVGMSTIPEVMMARYCGMSVAAISCITNSAAGKSAQKLSHAEVLARGRQSGEKAAQLMERFAREYNS